MKLRTAKKIMTAVGTPRETAYTDDQIGRAVDRYERTRSAREANRFWFAFLDDIGVSGRAEVLAGSGAPGMAFDLLMRTSEEEW
jgi:hypothetical protein